MTEIEVLRDGDAVAAAAAELLAGHVVAGGQIALSGGSTPKAAYAALAARDPQWDRVTLWLGDERLVAADDERSNFRMAREQLGAAAPIERVRTEDGLDEAARDYEARLRAALGGGGALDLAVMGLGPDGHTASLFPGQATLAERERWAAAVPEAGMEPYVPRVTLTLPVFDAAREVVFLVAGEEKAQALRRAFGDPPDSDVPSAHVRPRSGRLLVLCDEAAAAGLR